MKSVLPAGASFLLVLSAVLGLLVSERVLVMVNGFSVSSSTSTSTSSSCPRQQQQQQHSSIVAKHSPSSTALFSSSSSSSPTRNEDGTFRDDPTVIGDDDDDDDWETAEDETKNSKIIRFLETKYPSFYKLLVRDNAALRKELLSASSSSTSKTSSQQLQQQQQQQSFTLFVPNEEAMEALGAKKLTQIMDPRNEEIAIQIGNYHLVPGKALSATELRTEDWTRGRPKDGSKPNTLIAAIVTLAGEVPVGRSKSGGWFGTTLGAKEDGDIVIGPEAKIVQSFQVQDCLVHEMDALISPLQLWRYADQLRIPGF